MPVGDQLERRGQYSGTRTEQVDFDRLTFPLPSSSCFFK